ncbi:MAG: AarF/UbiB family protein [Puniceicoccaceae bacterium]
MKLHLIRDAVRAKEIVTILLKYRFDQILENTDLPAAWLTRFVPPVHEKISLWRRIRLAIEELGPTFIKIGQVLSTRPDILPMELIIELEALQDQITPLDFEKMQPALEKELGCPYEEVFTEFNKEPAASASLGQIYRARLKSNGQEVAVKIQKPGLRKPIRTDLEIMVWLAEQIHENIEALRPLDLPTVLEELKQGLLDELNFAIEARNASVFNSLNQFPEKVFAPEIIEAYTTSRLLVSEWIDGKTPARTRFSPEEASEIAKTGGSSFFSQIVMTGFFHGDPHPGNILVTPDGRLCLLDWGLAGQLTSRMRYALIDLFAACAKRDAAMVTRVALQLGRVPHRMQRTQLEKAVTTVLFKYDADLKRMENLGRVIFEMIFVFGSHGIHVARDYTLLAKSIISLERTATLLDPDFNLAEVGEPFIQRLNWERWNPGNLASSILADWREKWTHLSELPQDLQRVLHRMEDGELPVILEHRGVYRATNTIHHAFSRLSLAVIIGSLVIGSSIVINTGIKPLLWGFPAIGLIGYILSAAIGAYVAFDILRSGRRRPPHS